MLADGLYQVTSRFCAGFVVADNRIRWCAPILRPRLFSRKESTRTYWLGQAVLVVSDQSSPNQPPAKSAQPSLFDVA